MIVTGQTKRRETCIKWCGGARDCSGLAIALLGTLSAYRANPAEVKVLSAVAVKSALDDLIGKFEGET
jgi:hypothetical protein